MVQVLWAWLPNKLTNWRKGVMNGWLKSTNTDTVLLGPPASSVGL
jgi:hypothetical protein